MAFTNTAQIKAYLMKHMETAVKQAQKKAYDVISTFLKKYYSEFSPSMYERTYQLLSSLVESQITSTGNGYRAEIYFDASRLDYSMKLVNGKPISNRGWSAEKTLNAAMTGSHGGYAAGTAIWDESEAVLNSDIINILKQSLISSGIPVK